MAINLLATQDGVKYIGSITVTGGTSNRDNIIDGSIVTYDDILNAGEYWQLDFGSVIDVCKLRVYFLSSGTGHTLTAFEIKLSANGSDWTRAKKLTTPAYGGWYTSINLDAWNDLYINPTISARYIRLKITGNDARLAEVEVYQTTNPVSCVITSDDTDFDSALTDHDEEVKRRMHLDGDLSRPYDKINSGKFIKFDLENVSELTQIDIYSTGGEDYRLKISTNDIDWTTLFDGYGSAGWNIHTSSLPASARYIKIESKNYLLDLREIRVWGKATEKEELDDTITLSDNIELNLSREKAELNDILNLSDEIILEVSREKVELADALSLSDNIFFHRTERLELEDILYLSDEIYINTPQENLILEDILSLSDEIEIIVSRREIIDINNDFRTVIQSINDIPNKINTAIQVVQNWGNRISLVFGKVYTILNDIRTHALSRYNVKNDFRMLQSWQIPGDAGFQSLGKEYIKIYINSVEQTDIDVNSISISQPLNTSHTAIFKLGRPYDNTKPATESLVEIKYSNWLIYKGYITSIIPTGSPESIQITCRDNYWKRNKTLKYFYVGHKTSDNPDIYYTTINNALSAQLGWNPGVGNFIPEAISCFALGESNCITSLISESGNFAWFYKKNDTKKLWIAGQGNVVSLERQSLGQNLGLHQVLQHQFSESIVGIINKFRVQMGDFVLRRFNSSGETRKERYYNVNSTIHPSPAWGENAEVLAQNSVDGYGLDYHSPNQNEKYADVFRKYNLTISLVVTPEPVRNMADLNQYTDRYPPKVYISKPFGDWMFSDNVHADVDFFGNESDRKILTDGFTIDYEKDALILNEPMFVYRRDTKGKLEIRRPIISLGIWKKISYPDTNEGDNPAEDISNPLMFFTDKCGSYPETIMGQLDLTGLSIQVGGWYISDRIEYEDRLGRTRVLYLWTYIPSWDDTNFAKDVAKWRLTQNCEKKISGNIVLSLDTMVLYDIDLAKRIYIEGITDFPLNIISISYNMSSFTATLQLENKKYYKRSVSLPSRGVVWNSQL